MSLRKRWWVVAALVLVFVVLPAMLMYSGTLLRVVVIGLADRVPELSIGAVEGRLATGARVTDLRWRADDGVDVTIDQVTAEWRLLPLLTGRLRVDSLVLGQTVITLPARSATRDSGALVFDLPLDLVIRALEAGDVTVRHGGETQLTLTRIRGAQLRGAGPSAGVETLEFLWALPDARSGTGTLSGNTDTELAFTLALDDGTLDIDGRLLRPLADTSVAADIRLRAFEPADWVDDAPEMAIDATLTVRGWIEDLAIAGDIRTSGPEVPATEARVDVRWGASLLTVRRMELESELFPGSMVVSGRYDWSTGMPTARARAAWQSEVAEGRLRAALDGGTVTFDAEGDALGGAVTLQGAVEWPINDGVPRGRTVATWRDIRYDVVTSPSGTLELRGALDDWNATLRDVLLRVDANEISVAGTARGRSAEVEAIALNASGGGARLRLDGTLTDAYNFRWRLAIPDFSEIATAMDGTLHADGTVTGPRHAPRIRSDLALSLASPVGQWAVALQADARWVDAALNGTLSQVTVAHAERPAWASVEPIAFTAAAGRASIDQSCWHRAGRPHRFCVNGDWSADTGARAQVTLAELELAELGDLLPAGFIYEGTITGTAGVTMPSGGIPTVDGQLAIGAGAWRQHLDDEVIDLLRWRQARVEGRLVDGTLAGEAQADLTDGGVMHATLELPVMDNDAGSAMQRRLSAHFLGRFSDFGLIPALLPEVGSMSGEVTADLRVTGTRTAPQLGGELAVADGRMTIPPLGLQLSELELRVTGAGGALDLTARARSGDGTLRAAGGFRLEDDRIRGNATLHGDGFQAANLPEANIRVSPDLTLDVDGHTIRIGGSIEVPYARITARNRVGVIARSDDEVLLDAAGDPEEATPWRVHARVRVGIGDTRFRGFGLSGAISGGLTVIEDPGLPTRATGELLVTDGRYMAWGQQLEIERGRLLFTGGPITQPGLDVRAVRRPQDVMVGVDVRGTLQKPEMHLVSEPPMQQAELLSWLVLGLPLQQASGEDQQLLDSATRSAGLAGGEYLVREVGRQLGLGNVGIEHGAQPDQAALVIGHYLSPRVYVAYGIGIFDAERSLRLRYLLDRQWSIRARTSERATSADLEYTIER